jgi:hypothetical protein
MQTSGTVIMYERTSPVSKWPLPLWKDLVVMFVFPWTTPPVRLPYASATSGGELTLKEYGLSLRVTGLRFVARLTSGARPLIRSKIDLREDRQDAVRRQLL